MHLVLSIIIDVLVSWACLVLAGRPGDQGSESKREPEEREKAERATLKEQERLIKAKV